jgi:hydroxyethylthiazole kinase-like uncharacterized protein yjeF
VKVFDEGDVARQWPMPQDHDDKYARGVVGIDTGSPRYPGAAVLSVLGAVYSGAGFVRFCGPEAVRARLVELVPSVTFGAGGVNVWLAGCGWDETQDNRERLARLLGDGVPAVLDAGALRVLPAELPPGSLLTPHAGELARLLRLPRAEVEADPVGCATRAAQRWGACVLIKGHQQYVAAPDGEVSMAVVGPAWTAQAGSGDLLAGIAASVMAQGCAAPLAAWLAASVQAMAAQRHLGPYPPHELARFLPELIGGFAE